LRLHSRNRENNFNDERSLPIIDKASLIRRHGSVKYIIKIVYLRESVRCEHLRFSNLN